MSHRGSRSVADLAAQCGGNLREVEIALREFSLQECLREIDSDYGGGEHTYHMNQEKNSFISADGRPSSAKPTLENHISDRMANNNHSDVKSKQDSSNTSSDDKLSV